MGEADQRSAPTAWLLSLGDPIRGSLLVGPRLGGLHATEVLLSLWPLGGATEGAHAVASHLADHALAVPGWATHREYDPVMRVVTLLFALWVAASVGARTLLGNACAAHASDAWEACVSGLHPRKIMECMGHSSISVTMDRYGHLAPAAGREAALLLDQMFGTAAAG